MINKIADPGGRAFLGVGLRPLAGWDCGFESRRGHGFLSLVLCVVRYRSLRRADPSSRGALPSECVSLSANRCNNSPLHLPSVGKKISE